MEFKSNQNFSVSFAMRIATSLALILAVRPVFGIPQASALEILCPERYSNNSILIDSGNIRYQGGARLKDELVWRYPGGQRLVDGAHIRYSDGKRLIDDDNTWRYPTGDRILNQGQFRYPSGKIMRDLNGVFLDQSGKTLPNQTFDYVFTGADSTIIKLILSKSDAQMMLKVQDQEHSYELVFEPTKSVQPKKIICRLNTITSPGQTFSIISKAAIVDVHIQPGQDPHALKTTLESALKSLESTKK